MSDTPRTDAGLEYDDTTVDGVKKFARRLEGELNAANERIKRLEEAGDAMVNEGWNEPHLAEAWRKAKEVKL